MRFGLSSWLVPSEIHEADYASSYAYFGGLCRNSAAWGARRREGATVGARCGGIRYELPIRRVTAVHSPVATIRA